MNELSKIRRVMPSIIAKDIDCVSPMVGPKYNFEKLIVALDFYTIEQAREFVNNTLGTATFFKIGPNLLYQPGIDDFINELKSKNLKVFVDCKLLDVANTVRLAVANLASKGIDMITVHSEPDVILAARHGRGSYPMKIIGVTVLTSSSNEYIKNLGYTCSMDELVKIRAKIAINNGCDGIIASASDDLKGIRNLFPDKEFLIATPGIRFNVNSKELDEQVRTSRPEQAIKNGADYIIIGRPIIEASYPIKVLYNVANEIAHVV